MSIQNIRGIQLGLAHERERIDRIERDTLTLRYDLRSRQRQVVARLRHHHDRVEWLIGAIGTAREEDAARLTELAYRAWKKLRIRILETQPVRRLPRPGVASGARREPPGGPPLMHCFANGTPCVGGSPRSA